MRVEGESYRAVWGGCEKRTDQSSRANVVNECGRRSQGERIEPICSTVRKRPQRGIQSRVQNRRLVIVHDAACVWRQGSSGAFDPGIIRDPTHLELADTAI